jgi:hypothetical protein
VVSISILIVIAAARVMLAQWPKYPTRMCPKIQTASQISRLQRRGHRVHAFERSFNAAEIRAINRENALKLLGRKP